MSNNVREFRYDGERHFDCTSQRVYFEEPKLPCAPEEMCPICLFHNPDEYSKKGFPENSYTRVEYGEKNPAPVTLHTEIREIVNDDSGFKTTLNVPNFQCEKMSVKVVEEQRIDVHAEEEKKKGDGNVKREFTHQFFLPEDVDATTVIATLKAGILTIQARKKKGAALSVKSNERVIPIET